MRPGEGDPAAALIDRYDRAASAYRELWAPTLRFAGRRLLSELAMKPATRILDIAAGVGTLLPELRDSYPSAPIVGVDRSPGMLALAPKEFPVAVMDACRLAIAPSSVDLVVLAFVLFLLQEPDAGLREAARVLTTDGRIGCITWAKEFDSPAERIWDKCLDVHGAEPGDPAGLSRQDPVDSPTKMEALLRGAGFTNVRSWEEELADDFDIDRLLRLKTNLGSDKVRFDSLDPAARAACLHSARQQMATLSPGDFTSRGRVIYSVGEGLRSERDSEVTTARRRSSRSPSFPSR